MGSDRSPDELFEGVLQASNTYPHVPFHIFATDDFLTSVKTPTHFTFHTSSQVIGMDEEPVKAVKSKKHSSLVEGIRFLRRKKIRALISAGNTGALVAAASLFLHKLPGIRRLPLLATLPSQKGGVSVVDVGSTLYAKPELLLQFAELGVAHHRLKYQIEKPRVGLLNIGSESKKGSEERKRAHFLLDTRFKDAQDGHFIGNIEGRDVFSGAVDLLVTDGFSGNVLLKTAEGMAFFIFNKLLKVASSPLKKEMEEVSKHFNYNEYPGAVVLGVDSLLIKCHGASSPKAIFHAIKGVCQILKI